MDAVAHFTQFARYNVWATARLLDAVRALPEEDYRRDVGLFFHSIHGTLNHLLVGEHHRLDEREAQPPKQVGEQEHQERLQVRVFVGACLQARVDGRAPLSLQAIGR